MNIRKPQISSTVCASSQNCVQRTSNETGKWWDPVVHLDPWSASSSLRSDTATDVFTNNSMVDQTIAFFMTKQNKDEIFRAVLKRTKSECVEKGVP